MRNEAAGAPPATAYIATRQREQRVGSAEAWFSPTEDRLDADEAARRLAELPLDLREVIVARLWGGLTFEEIAALVGCSLPTAHRRYHTGLAQLRERLEGQWTRTQRSDLSDLERRLANCKPAADGLDADAMLFAAGRAATQPGPARFLWPTLTAGLAALSLILGVWLANERAERLALLRQHQQSVPAPVPAPSPAAPLGPVPSTADQPSTSSLLAAHQAAGERTRRPAGADRGSRRTNVRPTAARTAHPPGGPIRIPR